MRHWPVDEWGRKGSGDIFFRHTDNARCTCEREPKKKPRQRYRTSCAADGTNRLTLLGRTDAQEDAESMLRKNLKQREEGHTDGRGDILVQHEKTRLAEI